MLGEGDNPSVVEVESQGIFLRGLVRVPAVGAEDEALNGVLALHPARAFKIAGVIVPKPRARLVWRLASAGKVAISGIWRTRPANYSPTHDCYANVSRYPVFLPSNCRIHRGDKLVCWPD